MDDINRHFLDPFFAIAINNLNIKINTDFIKKVMIKFIKGETTLAPSTRLSDVLDEKTEDFKEINVATFKEMKFFIFYKLNYDYSKLKKIEYIFYRFLDVASELVKMKKSNSNTPENEYTDAFKKLFAKSKNFARRQSNPVLAKGEETFNTFFSALEKSVVQHDRKTREQYRKELIPLDKKVATLKKDIYATNKQNEDMLQKIVSLFREYDNDVSTKKYIMKMIDDGSIFSKSPNSQAVSPSAAAVGGKKRVRRSVIGGTRDSENIIGYFKNLMFDFEKVTFRKNPNGSYNVDLLYSITLSFLVNKTNKTNNSIIPQLVNILDKPILKGEFDKIWAKISLTDNKLLNDVKENTSPSLADLIKGNFIKPIPDTYSMIIYQLLKYNYERHPKVILNNKLEDLV